MRGVSAEISCRVRAAGRQTAGVHRRVDCPTGGRLGVTASEEHERHERDHADGGLCEEHSVVDQASCAHPAARSIPRLKSMLSAKNRLIFVAAAALPMMDSTSLVKDAVTIPSVNV